ncbi:ABC transporter substrate-binding protein [Alcaligenaceae bacterium]|uniref:ABC transporter substrate-binding protein n=1 Tax=Pusillimonas sp. MFBS29 TaxID=2886690 RepID=UPI0015D297C4|nr:ABC transporter substrate-binding protein [Pusillimonas sp. MFBS29]MCC2596242.1 ABC transporter substrate-binding protein [Pusillimonas sp. MFBS29]NYT58615.1 ABC transporter substrate-binding protein [Alcaligenaceae bacterium]
MHFRTKLAVAVVAALCSSTVVWADQTLYVAANGGSTEKVMKEKLFPVFEKEHPGVKVVQVTGTSTQSLAKLQAQRNNPEIGVAILDDGPMWQAMQLGFCSDVNSDTYKNLYSMANIGGKAMGVGLVATGLAYNTEAFKKMGLPAPDSWEDLLNPKLKQKVVIPSITNTYGLHALVVFARLRGGGEKNIEPGFKAMIEEAQPNVLSWEPAPGKLAELFQNGSVLLAAHGSGRVQALKNTGFPVEMVYPKEGAVSLQIAACAIEKSPEPELAQAFLEFLSRPETQTILAQSEGWGPTNKTVELSPELAKQVPYGADAVENMLVVDWTTVNPKRNEWTTRWNRTVER